MATWNVNTMLKPGRMKEIANQLIKYNIDIAALQETRWNDNGRIDKKEFSILYSGPKKKTGQAGTGFFVNNKLRKSILNFEAISDRLCKLRIKGKFRNISIFSVYAPTEDADDEIKEDFYDSLGCNIEKVPRYDVVILLGDFNAKIGKEEPLREVAGKYSLHEETNENGKLLAQCAQMYSLHIKSTCFPHKSIHKGTWKAPGRNVVNQIDHVLISTRHSSNITDVRSMRGPNCDSDHFLVRAKLRQRLAKVARPDTIKRTKWNTDKLKSEEELKRFQEVIDREMERQRIEENEVNSEENSNLTVEERWKVVKNSLCKAAEETIGEVKEGRNREWFNERCERAIEVKNQARQRLLQRHTRQNYEVYCARRREAKKICREEKRKMINRRLEDIERLDREHESGKCYKEINWFRKAYQAKINNCKSKTGKALEGEIEVMNRWTEHFSELLNIHHNDLDEDEDENVVCYPQPLVEGPDKNDVDLAIQNLKNCKAPGEDRIVAELLKGSSNKMKDAIYDLICDVWNQETMPKDWTVGLICPVFKKGSKDQCSNYRGITLLGVLYKVLSNIILRKLTRYTEEILGDYQCGFRVGRGTTDQIFVLRQAMEKAYEYGIDLHILFIDYRQAFDSVKRSVLLKILKKNGIPHKLINLISMTMDGASSKVMLGNKVGNAFEVKSGVRQGDALSATLFNVALHDAVKDATKNGTIVNKTWQLCAYADDLVLIARSETALKEAFAIIIKNGSKVGLIINETKTKCLKMSVSESRRSLNSVQLSNFTFETVPSFVYLGSSLNNKNVISHEIERRIMSGNKAFFANLKLLKSQLLSKRIKLKLYKSLIRPVVTYGAETWCLSNDDCRKLKVFERKIVRRIYGAKQVDGLWRIRSNAEIESLLRNENIVNYIKANRLRWAGHVVRMERERLQKRILEENFSGKRKKGRPRSRWRDEVEKDARMLDVRNWMSEAQDREKWREITRQAKGHPDL